MDKSLKNANKKYLTAVFLANIFAYIFISKFGFDVSSLWSSISELEKFIPLTIAIIFIGILNSQITPEIKAKIVFWKIKDPLPGCRAFSDYMELDVRVDSESLKHECGFFPIKPLEQNKLWYKWYREVQDESAVIQSHGEYLFTRDYSALSLMFLFFFGGSSFIQFDSVLHCFGLIVLLLLQYLFVRNAAKNNGIQFVCNVLAAKSSPKKIVKKITT